MEMGLPRVQLGVSSVVQDKPNQWCSLVNTYSSVSLYMDAYISIWIKVWIHYEPKSFSSEKRCKHLSFFVVLDMWENPKSNYPRNQRGIRYSTCISIQHQIIIRIHKSKLISVLRGMKHKTGIYWKNLCLIRTSWLKKRDNIAAFW